MYVEIEQVVYNTHVALKLDNPVWVNLKGEVVESVDDNHGCKVHTQLNLHYLSVALL